MSNGVGAPAWYIVGNDHYLARWLNVLHLPYTAWHLSYVAMGAAMADQLRWDVLGWAILAFFLGMGVGAHCFDLVRGDPLALRLRRQDLALVGGISVAGATGIGVTQVLLNAVTPSVIFMVPIGVLLAVGYNLEWQWMHGDVQFALFWAVFPFLTAMVAMPGDSSWAALPVVLFAYLTAYAQRVLSTRARYLRRKVTDARVFLSPVEKPPGVDELKFSHPGATGRVSRWPATEEDKVWLLQPIDQALIVMSFAMPVLAGGLLLWRLLQSTS